MSNNCKRENYLLFHLKNQFIYNGIFVYKTILIYIFLPMYKFKYINIYCKHAPLSKLEALFAFLCTKKDIITSYHDVNAYMNTIVDEAIRHYYEFGLKINE